MSLHDDMSVFAGGRRVNLKLFATCMYVTLLHHPLLKHNREGSCLQGILFQICYEYTVRRLNNILIIGHYVTLILDNNVYNHTNLIYCVNSHIR